MRNSRDYFTEEWLTRSEMERLTNTAEFLRYLGLNVDAERPDGDVLVGDEMRVDVTIVRCDDGPRD